MASSVPGPASGPLPHGRHRPPTSNPGASMPQPPHARSTTPPVLADEAAGRRRVSKRLHKKRKDGIHSPTVELPDRLKETPEEASKEEDVLASRPGTAGMYMNLNQSIFGLIAAAGSRVDFGDRFDGQSSDEGELDEPSGHIAEGAPGIRRKGGSSALGSQTTILRKPASDPAKADKKHRRIISEGLMRSVPVLSRLSTKAKHRVARQKSTPEEVSSSDGLDAESPTIQVAEPEGRLAPVMSRMLQARAAVASRPSFDLDRASGDTDSTDAAGETGPSELAKRLKEIFEFEEPEEVIDEYPCWLMQNVLLQGYMYITAKHVCFYSYLPKKAHETAKTGYLSKSGKRNPKYNRYWFRLKGDVLSYYTDTSNLYFPHGQIDLRYGISADITDKSKDAVHFSLVTAHRTYYFRADSTPSAKEWVKSLQRVIFRSHNDGDSVKISLPLENVIDVEDAYMVTDFADTCKIRVIDNDETYAIDEYYFSFFASGKEAINILKILAEASQTQREEAGDRSVEMAHSHPVSGKKKGMAESRGRPVPTRLHTSRLEGVKATLSPMSPAAASANSPRASGEFARGSFDALRQFGRRSLDVSQIVGDVPRRSFSGTRRSLSKNRGRDAVAQPEQQASSDSYVMSLEDPSQASMSALVASSSDDPSASQILRGSDVFLSPTIQRSPSATRIKSGDADAGQMQPPKRPGPGPYIARHAATTGHVADPGAGERPEVITPSTPTLQSITKIGAYPLQRAGAFAAYLNSQSRRMSNLLATESMGYVEKVSGMWKGGRRHYDDPAGLRTDDEAVDDDPVDKAASNHRFRTHFALPDSENLQAAYFGYLLRVLPLYGKIYISDRHFCFRSLLPGTRTKLILPLKDIENANKEKGFRFAYSGLVLVIRGHEEIFFEFSKAEVRDDCAVTLLQNLEAARFLPDSMHMDVDEMESAECAMAERDALKAATPDERPMQDVMLLRHPSSLARDSPTMLFDDPKASFLNFKPSKPLRITCLTIGSRGDVQPYIALCKGLIAEGHKPRIATHAEFQGWIESHGIDFACVGGDPGELMRLCIQNGTFTWAFLKEANSKFRGWLDDLLASTWTACQGTDLLIESPSAMAGIHIAEAMGIPYFRAFTMPWTRTRAYPHAFIMPEHKMGGAYNLLTYTLFDTVFWKSTATQINRWRNSVLNLPNTNLEKMQPNKVPFLYNFSPSFVPPPLDYSDWIHVTGYWFLDEGSDRASDKGTTPAQDEEKQALATGTASWTPPKDLTDFIQKAHDDDKRLVYVGFGSIIVPDVAKMTQEVIDAVLKADVRCILSKGWSERPDAAAGKHAAHSHAASAADNTATAHHEKEPARLHPELPPEILQIKAAPHDWLFEQIDAAAHHGGAGTTGASLRAGIPTIVRPFFGDQFFSGSRVEDLGVGICLKKWGANSFARALWEATHSERMIARARDLGRQIRMENGVDTAIQCMYRDLEYAKSLIKAKVAKNKNASAAAAAAPRGHHHKHRRTASANVLSQAGEAAEAPSSEYEAEDDDDDDTEEAWTFVGSDEVILDPDTVLRRSSLLGQVATAPAALGRGPSAAAELDEKKSLDRRDLGSDATTAAGVGSATGGAAAVGG